jgi:hypothetical protein
MGSDLKGSDFSFFGSSTGPVCIAALHTQNFPKEKKEKKKAVT